MRSCSPVCKSAGREPRVAGGAANSQQGHEKHMSSILDQDKVGAFCRFNHIELEGARSGPLAGLSFAAKDIYDVAGAKTGFGNPDWLRTHEVARRSAPAVQMLLDAGARLAGKTHTEEMAWSL